MKDKIKRAIENYQCSGCVCGCDIECYEKSSDLSCEGHCAGTMIYPGIGRIFLGMPTGFNRIGSVEKMNINIFNCLKDGWGYDKFNVPTWKYLDQQGNTLVRGIQPRINRPFIHIFLENCMDKIECLKITEQDLSEMD